MYPRPPRTETLNYRPGGFHPVHLDDAFKSGRYIIVHKLGHGGFATVWLARDTIRERYVALKILAARLSRDCPEVEILRRLRGGKEQEGKSFVMSMLDHFWIEGPNGSHLCVVSQVGGPSLKQFNECPGQRTGSRRLRGEVARKVAWQATEGLAYIHSMGTVHGDFTAANILLQLANINEWTVKEIHERLGEPQTQPLLPPKDEHSLGSGPRYTVNAISMKLVNPRWLLDKIMIIDFGIAFIEDEPSIDIGTPKNYCAPEFNFKGNRTAKSDIWALGCTIFEIRTGSCLFQFRGIPTRDEMLIATVKVLGTLPDLWWNDWEEGRTWYAVESQPGGQLAEILHGTLRAQIMEIGIFDGDSNRGQHETHHDMGFGKDNVSDSSKKKLSTSPSHKHSSTTNRLLALVEELTTSEASEVMAMINKQPESGSSQEKSSEGSSGKAQNSGSGSGSSGAKSGGKSMSSEGISIDAQQDPEKCAGPQGMGGHQVAKTVVVSDFLEVAGTIITHIEADGLENLLRKALAMMPAQRLSASSLAKHHWFSDSYKLEIGMPAVAE